MRSFYDFSPCYARRGDPLREPTYAERRACVERLFRLFYNQSLHPELQHMERRRRRLIRLLALSALLLAGVVVFQVYANVFLLTLLLFIPVAIWIAYLGFRVQTYFREFKPRIVDSILDFIDNDTNFQDFAYQAKGGIARETFLASRIFTTADEYMAEDYISGQVREMPFEICELRVNEFSVARSRMDRVFHGIFFVGDFKRPNMPGALLMLPDAYLKYLNRSERAFHLLGGRRVREHLLPELETSFNTYATADLRLQDVLSKDMQHAILEFRQEFQRRNRHKEIYLSIVGGKIYIALSLDKDILEPSLFHSNVNFETVKEFYEDIQILLDIVRDVDVMN